jgi:hypothetical protein
MGGLMHDLATMARLDSAQPRLEIDRVDLEGLVARVMGRHRPIARELEVEIECSTPAEPVAVLADLTLLEQAVSNLLYNAIRHDRPGGHAVLILEEDGDRFRLRVIDDGPGNPRGGAGPSDRSRLPRQRGPHPRSRRPGARPRHRPPGGGPPRLFADVAPLRVWRAGGGACGGGGVKPFVEAESGGPDGSS